MKVYYLYSHIYSAAMIGLLSTFKGKSSFFLEKKYSELVNLFNLGFFEHLHETVRLKRWGKKLRIKMQLLSDWWHNSCILVKSISRRRKGSCWTSVCKLDKRSLMCLVFIQPESKTEGDECMGVSRTADELTQEPLCASAAARKTIWAPFLAARSLGDSNQGSQAEQTFPSPRLQSGFNFLLWISKLLHKRRPPFISFSTPWHNL